MQIGKGCDLRAIFMVFALVVALFTSKLSELEDDANDGNTTAQFDLGFVYGEGLLGAKQDVSQAKKWWKKAASNSHDGAMVNLGVLEFSLGNIQEAVGYFEQAVLLNNPLAMCHLAELYAVSKDESNLTKASSLAMKGFELGETRCQKIWYIYQLNAYKNRSNKQGQ